MRRSFFDIEEEIERLFDTMSKIMRDLERDFFDDRHYTWRQKYDKSIYWKYNHTVDKNGNEIIKIYLPEINKDTLNIELEDYKISVIAQTEDEDEIYFSIPLYRAIDKENTTFKYKDGMLYIYPKYKEEKKIVKWNDIEKHE